ncbi:MAG: hypothetical protein M0006_07405 [Magnetospirillum sp.]|nr:hypothetical protein [Magnetospirillum sp.]
MRLPRAIAVAPLFLVAACAAGVDGGSAGAPSGEQAPPKVQDAPGNAAARAIVEPSRLKGLTAIQVKALLGAPGFTRRDAPAEIWQYRSGRCTLDLFLYDGAAGQTVEGYDVRSSDSMAEKDCFDTLVQVGRALPAG